MTMLTGKPVQSEANRIITLTDPVLSSSTIWCSFRMWRCIWRMWVPLSQIKSCSVTGYVLSVMSILLCLLKHTARDRARHTITWHGTIGENTIQGCMCSQNWPQNILFLSFKITHALACNISEPTLYVGFDVNHIYIGLEFKNIFRH